jgi:hypothetical protein
MVCTIGYVHTILQNVKVQFKMSLLGAYPLCQTSCHLLFSKRMIRSLSG